MVIMDATYRAAMLTNGSHHYIQPDPFVPASTAMDAKTSPLAMLQRTCSQIGADTTALSKPLITADKKRDRNTPSSPAAAASAAAAAPAEKPTFKPYDLDRKDPKPVTSSPATSPSSATAAAEVTSPSEVTSPRGRKSPGRSSEGRKSSRSGDAAGGGSGSGSGSGSSPITRSGAEVLAGCGAKELAGLGLRSPGALPLPLPPYMPGGEAGSAALRSTLPGLPGLYSQLPLSAVSYLGLQPLHRPGDKCSSPYCPCALTPAATGHGYGAACPAGCVQCEHAKALSGALQPPYLGLASPFYPPPPASVGLGMQAAAAGGQPIVCSWMADGRYCGKRFATTDELMQHLRTHTNLSASDAPFSLMHPAYQASVLAARPPLCLPATSLSPMSSPRYHPYGKPGSALSLSPAAHPSLAAYYSPYALYARPPTLP